MLQYLNPRKLHRWKYATHLYYACWCLIFLILAYYTFLLLAWTYPQLLTSQPRPWLPSLPLLFCSLAVVYCYSREQSRRSAAKGQVIVEQALASQQAQARVDYLMRILHDLRSPLTTILNALPLVERRQNSGTYLQSIKSACHYAVGLAGKALRQAGIAEGEQVRLEPVLLTGWLQEVLDMQKPTANQMGVILKGSIEEHLPDYLLADRELLTRMLVNLTDNAIAYSPPNKDVMVALYQHQQSGHLIVQVTNETTAPVPDDAFQPYVRDRIGGTGLGLAITRSLAESMGGSAYAEELKESGRTAFFISIPLRPAAPPSLKQPDRQAPIVTDAAGNGLQVMLIEDDDDLRTVISENMISSGIATKVISVGSGQQGVDQALIALPDVVVTDDRLIGMDGLEVARQLKGMDRTRGIPVVVITGDVHPLRKEQYEALGVTEFMEKPFNLGGLGRAIRRAVAP